MASDTRLKAIQKRLWNIDRLRGLHIRRDKEADMVEYARTDYADGELIRV